MTIRDGEIKWLSGWLADEIARQAAGIVDGKVGVYLRPEQWRAAIARLRGLRADGERPQGSKKDG